MLMFSRTPMWELQDKAEAEKGWYNQTRNYQKQTWTQATASSTATDVFYKCVGEDRTFARVIFEEGLGGYDKIWPYSSKWLSSVCDDLGATFYKYADSLELEDKHRLVLLDHASEGCWDTVLSHMPPVSLLVKAEPRKCVELINYIRKQNPSQLDWVSRLNYAEVTRLCGHTILKTPAEEYERLSYNYTLELGEVYIQIWQSFFNDGGLKWLSQEVRSQYLLSSELKALTDDQLDRLDGQSLSDSVRNLSTDRRNALLIRCAKRNDLTVPYVGAIHAGWGGTLEQFVCLVLDTGGLTPVQKCRFLGCLAKEPAARAHFINLQKCSSITATDKAWLAVSAFLAPESCADVVETEKAILRKAVKLVDDSQQRHLLLSSMTHSQRMLLLDPAQWESLRAVQLPFSLRAVSTTKKVHVVMFKPLNGSSLVDYSKEPLASAYAGKVIAPTHSHYAIFELPGTTDDPVGVEVVPNRLQDVFNTPIFYDIEQAGTLSVKEAIHWAPSQETTVSGELDNSIRNLEKWLREQLALTAEDACRTMREFFQPQEARPSSPASTHSTTSSP